VKESVLSKSDPRRDAQNMHYNASTFQRWSWLEIRAVISISAAYSNVVDSHK